jgi:predicted ester cyclase
MEQIQRVALRFFQEQDRLRDGPAPELCADGYRAYLGHYPPMDLAGHKAFSTGFYGAFPDLRHDVEEILVDGERAAVRFRLTGTNTGEFMGNPPSGRSMAIGGMVFMTVRAGKVTELRGEFDEAGLAQQLA